MAYEYPKQMSDIEDIIEGLFHVGVLAVTYKIGQDSQKAFTEAYDRNDMLGMIFSAIAAGASAYGFQWSSRNINRLVAKYRLPNSDPRTQPGWALPK